MKLRPIDPAIPDVAVDASLLYDTRLMPGSETIVHELSTILTGSGLHPNSDLYQTVMSELLRLIVTRDDEVFRYAYKAGRQSV